MNLFQILEQQDVILKVSFSILVLMSIISWSVIVIRSIFAIVERKRYKKTINDFEQSTNLIQMQENIKDDKSTVSCMIKDVVLAYSNYVDEGKKDKCGINAQLPLKDYLLLSIRNALGKQNSKFEGGLTALASIGAVAPFIGLFGTVWGIFNTLMDISTQGQVSIATVSAPIGEALVATAMGLFVAIPAVLAYNAITRINKNISKDFENFAHDLYVHLLNAKEE